MPTNIIVAGSETLTESERVIPKLQAILDEFYPKKNKFLLAGRPAGTGKSKPIAKRGIGTIAYSYAEIHKIKCQIYSENIEDKAASAVLVNNAIMVQEADALIFFWDGVCYPMFHLIREAVKMSDSRIALDSGNAHRSGIGKRMKNGKLKK